MKKQFVQNDNNMAVAYYRFSSHAQNEQSIDQQRELAEEYAQIHGLTIVKEYADEALNINRNLRKQDIWKLQNLVFGLQVNCSAVNVKNLCKEFPARQNQEEYITTTNVKTIKSINVS